MHPPNLGTSSRYRHGNIYGCSNNAKRFVADIEPDLLFPVLLVIFEVLDNVVNFEVGEETIVGLEVGNHAHNVS